MRVVVLGAAELKLNREQPGCSVIHGSGLAGRSSCCTLIFGPIGVVSVFGNLKFCPGNVITYSKPVKNYEGRTSEVSSKFGHMLE
jgi:hypothetical protein